MNNSTQRAKFINQVTIGAVYFLILVGGIVRTMEAGMGCPDWPKCFGQVIPPSDNSELPEDYQEQYVESRLKKNDRLATTLDFLGMTQLAEKVRKDPKIREYTFFDVEKAWVEYINRLVGVLIGFLILINAYYSFQIRKRSSRYFYLGILSLLLVLFQGWVGSLVVSTNLLPGFITFHMVLALLLVGLLIAQQVIISGYQSQYHDFKGSGVLKVLFVLFFIQIILGTQVREQIDIVKHTDLLRSEWIDSLGLMFYIHRSYSLILMGLSFWLVYVNWKGQSLTQPLILFAAMVIVEILLGVVMAYFSVPSFAQPTHLFLGTVSMGLLFYLILVIQTKPQIQ